MQQVDLAAFCHDWLAAWMSGDAPRLRRFYSQDAFYSDPARPQGLRGPELLSYFEKLLAKNPGWLWEAAEILPTAKGFCLKWQADFRPGQVTGLDIVELDGRLITRNEVYFDRAALLR
jgi:hypothetical protein